ncbi:BTB/POZ domain-containing protein POB1-like [Lotus japonicus]|uniref:BTB/POZ domain-containing protein POB1-like n=1 Tax=Lotus japonicus TaxID=34305 RepID=UPI002589986B|nr:BTB/POZ domain-containing protein POB1-like [Lotus japonicus]
MALDSALFYLELPHTIQMAYAIQPLIDAAKQYLVSRYKDLTKCMQQEEVMALPLSEIEAILASDDLHVESEDVVARELVIEALLFKEQPPASLEANHRRFVERAYKLRHVTVLQVQLPWQQHHYVVGFNLKREECANLFPSGQLYSHPFHLGVHAFFLKAECNMDQQSSFHCFGLFLGMPENAYSAESSLAVDYEFTARSRPPEPIANEFLSKYKGNCTFTEGTVVGHKNMFAMPWNSFIAQDSLLFKDDVLHLKVRLTIKT